MRRAAAGIVPLVLAANLAHAQHRARGDAGRGDDAGPSPRAMVSARRGGFEELAAWGGRQTRDELVERTERLVRVMPGRCYALIGAATGAAQVRVQVRARVATVVAPTPIANSLGEAVRRDFCARFPSDWYELLLTVEGAAQWHVALVELPGDAGAPEPEIPQVARSEREAPGDPPPPTFRPEPVGGAEQDYIGNQLRAYARARTRLVGFSPTIRTRLATNEAWSAQYALPAGRCVELVAAGVPSVADLVMELEDPAGQRVAQDGTHRATEALRHCPRFAGRYTARVRMFSGQGAVAIQLLIEP